MDHLTRETHQGSFSRLIKHHKTWNNFYFKVQGETSEKPTYGFVRQAFNSEMESRTRMLNQIGKKTEAERKKNGTIKNNFVRQDGGVKYFASS